MSFHNLMLKMLIFVFLIFSLSGCENENIREKQIKETLEYKLLYLDGKAQIPVDDPDLKKVRFYLDELAKSYQMTPDQIADISWAGKKDLRKSGIDEPILVLLATMHKLAQGKDPNLLRGSYATVMALYLVSREKK